MQHAASQQSRGLLPSAVQCSGSGSGSGSGSSSSNAGEKQRAKASFSGPPESSQVMLKCRDTTNQKCCWAAINPESSLLHSYCSAGRVLDNLLHSYLCPLLPVEREPLRPQKKSGRQKCVSDHFESTTAVKTLLFKTSTPSPLHCPIVLSPSAPHRSSHSFVLVLLPRHSPAATLKVDQLGLCS